MRLLITGAGGHLGRALVAMLGTETTHTVIPAVSPRQQHRTADQLVIDLERDDSILAGVEAARPDVIIHLAGLVGPACEHDAARTQQINVTATETLAVAAEQLGVSRVILASTAAIYGDTRPGPLPETTPDDAGSAYAASKLAAERVLQSHATGSLSAVALRIFNIYGPEFSGSLVTRLLAASAENPVALAGRTGFVRDYVDARDVSRAIISSLDAALPTPFAIVNIGSGEALSTGDVVDRLEQRATLHYTVGPERVSSSVADISVARALLHFDPAPLS